MLVEFRYKAVELFRAADFGVERIVIYDVVSMHAAGASLEARRDVAVTDAEHGKIGNNFGCLLECEFLIELQAIGGERDVRTGLHDSKDHTTDHAGSVPCWRVSLFTSSLA